MPMIHDNRYKLQMLHRLPQPPHRLFRPLHRLHDGQSHQRRRTAAPSGAVRTQSAQSNKRQKIAEGRSAHAKKEKAAPPMFRL